MELLGLCLRRIQVGPEPRTPVQHFGRAMLFLIVIIQNYGGYFAPPPFLHVVTDRLARLQRRFNAIAEQYAAGTLPEPTIAGIGPARAPRPTRGASPIDPIRRLPTRFAWLRQFIQVTVQPRSSIEDFMASPDCHAMLEAAPQLGRVLRPLCHMLGIPRPAVLTPPPRLQSEPAPPNLPSTQPTRTAGGKAGAGVPTIPPPPNPWKTNCYTHHLWGRVRPPKFA